MSRSTRIEFPGAYYHAMGRTIGRVKAFQDNGEQEKFLSLIGKRVETGDLIVHGFCLLPNHYHLLVETPRGQLSRWMQEILGVFAQWYNKHLGRSGPLWRGRYKAILVEGGPYLLECSRYIHLNPVRAGLEYPPERWKWSSYRNYLGGPKRPAVPWVTVKQVLSELSGTGVSLKKARHAYRIFVEEKEDSAAQKSPMEQAVAGLALGSEPFITWVKEEVAKRPLNEDEPALRQIRRHGLVPVEKIEQAVSAAFGDPYKKGLARRILAGLLVLLSGLRPSDVARRLGITRSAVSRCILREDRDPPFDRETTSRIIRLAASLHSREKE